MKYSSIDGWHVVGHCPRCGAPIWGKSDYEAKSEHLYPRPRIERSCACFPGSARPKDGQQPQELQEGEPG